MYGTGCSPLKQFAREMERDGGRGRRGGGEGVFTNFQQWGIFRGPHLLRSGPPKKGRGKNRRCGGGGDYGVEGVFKGTLNLKNSSLAFTQHQLLEGGGGGWKEGSLYSSRNRSMDRRKTEKEI